MGLAWVLMCVLSLFLLLFTYKSRFFALLPERSQTSPPIRSTAKLMTRRAEWELLSAIACVVYIWLLLQKHIWRCDAFVKCVEIFNLNIDFSSSPVTTIAISSAHPDRRSRRWLVFKKNDLGVLRIYMCLHLHFYCKAFLLLFFCCVIEWH